MITAVVLAAGAGARLGGPKALAELAGQTLLAHVLATCAASLVDEAIVVIGADAETVAAVAEREAGEQGELPVRVVWNDDWERGRTSSLQAGLAAATSGHHVLVFPVDHPAVDVTTLDVMLGAFGYTGGQPEVIVPVLTDARTGARRRGHPILLHARLREALLALGPDEPLHDFVHRHDVLEMPVDDPGILVNVNEPEDLTRAAGLLAARRP